MKSVVVTGASGLIGSECFAYFDQIGWYVHGIDNNMRMVSFGPDGDTRWNLNVCAISARILYTMT